MATAFAALVSLQNNLLLIRAHPRHSFSFENKQLRPLLESVRFLIEFMKRCDDTHGAIREAAEALEGRIARAVQAAEDVVESHVVDQIRGGSTLGGKRRPRFLLDLQKAIEDLDFVRRKTVNFQKLQSGFKAEEPTISEAEADASSENDRMVGFDGQLLRLLDLLTGVPSGWRVIPIVGMGGIGKTTLATNAFQHPNIAYHFDVCVWATVSPEFSVEKILTDLLSQIKGITSFLSSADGLGEKLYKSLFGRRYLIILDDMWSVEAWDKMRFFFPDTSNGSRIVVTTRQSNVARHLDSWQFNIPLLDEESSWDLFCHKTFEEEGCPPELEDIGKKIVANCGGLPLAIIVVGGHLRKSSRTTEYWKNISNDMRSVLNCAENERCLNILSLSYRYLPARLKPCFLSLGVFPKERHITVSDIQNIWIGEGFIQHFRKCTLKEAASIFLQELRLRNLISYYRKTQFGGTMRFCAVHDLLRELCLKIAKEEGFLSVLDSRQTINRERRVVIKSEIPEVNHQPQIFHAPRSTAVVRSLICEGGQISFDSKLLRVLSKVDTMLGTKDNIQQVNLRYLKVDLICKSDLPVSISSSISLLWNLQLLIITRENGMIIAPHEIWEMLQLKHVEVDRLCLPHPLPAESLVMENLHTFSRVENFMLSREVCRRIPNINELKLSYYGEPSLDYCPHNLDCFQKLNSLECYFDRTAKWRDFAFSLTFPNSLKHLRLKGCCLHWEEVTMKVGSLPRLQHLELFPNSVTGSEWSPVEGGFPMLRGLFIRHCDLIHWNANDTHFPVLEDVYLCGLSEFDEFPSGIGDVPTLRRITLADCSVSSIFSAMRMVVEQEQLGNEGIKLWVIFKGDEETLEGFKQKVETEGLRRANVTLILKKLEKKAC